MASAYGLKELKLPDSLRTIVLDSPTLVEGMLSSLFPPLDSDKNAVLAVSLDAEWNISRRIGVSVIQIAPHSHPDEIYIIPVRSHLYFQYQYSELPIRFINLKAIYHSLCYVFWSQTKSSRLDLPSRQTLHV